MYGWVNDSVHLFKGQCCFYTRGFLSSSLWGPLSWHGNGTMLVALILPLWKLLLSLYLSFTVFLAAPPPRGSLMLTGGAVKFDWLGSGFDAATSHPLREFKAIKPLQMSRHRCRELYWLVKTGASRRPSAQCRTVSLSEKWWAATRHVLSMAYEVIGLNHYFFVTKWHLPLTLLHLTYAA